MRHERNTPLSVVPQSDDHQSYGGKVDAELQVTLPGDEGSGDARRAVAILDRVFGLLDELDRAHPKRGEGKTTWTFTKLAIGSVGATIAVASPRQDVTVEEAESDLRLLVDGLAAAEVQEGIPAGWTPAAARAGIELTKLLGVTPSLAVVLGLVEDGQPAREVSITRRAGDHLSVPFNRRQVAIGSLTGELDGVTSHGARHEARLWLEHPKTMVRVYFREDLFESEIRPKLKKRVMVVGRIERDGADIPISIRMRPPIEVLPSLQDAPPLATFAGAAPDLTAGVDAADYVRRIRDSA